MSVTFKFTTTLPNGNEPVEVTETFHLEDINKVKAFASAHGAGYFHKSKENLPYSLYSDKSSNSYLIGRVKITSGVTKKLRFAIKLLTGENIDIRACLKVHNKVMEEMENIAVVQGLQIEGIIKTEANHQYNNKKNGLKGLIIQQLCTQDTLLTQLLSPHYSNEYSRVRTYHVQMAAIIMRLHKKNLLHFDLKLENFLLEGETVYLTDLTSLGTSGARVSVGTVDYLPPEFFLYGGWKTEANKPSRDIWSLGLCFYSLLFKNLPDFVHDYEASLENPSTEEYNAISKEVKSVLQKKLKLSPEFWEAEFKPQNIHSLIAGMLHPDPLRRPTATAVVQFLEKL